MIKLQNIGPTRREVIVGSACAIVTAMAVATCYEAKIAVLQTAKYSVTTVPTVRCNQDISAGAVITIASLRITNEYDEAHVPANSLNDPWIAVGRKACRHIAKGELLNFKDVFLNWMP